MKSERAANLALFETAARDDIRERLNARQIGRQVHRPGKAQPINPWRRIVRGLINWL